MRTWHWWWSLASRSRQTNKKSLPGTVGIQPRPSGVTLPYLDRQSVRRTDRQTSDADTKPVFWVGFVDSELVRICQKGGGKFWRVFSKQFTHQNETEGLLLEGGGAFQSKDRGWPFNTPKSSLMFSSYYKVKWYLGTFDDWILGHLQRCFSEIFTLGFWIAETPILQQCLRYITTLLYYSASLFLWRHFQSLRWNSSRGQNQGFPQCIPSHCLSWKYKCLLGSSIQKQKGFSPVQCAAAATFYSVSVSKSNPVWFGG